MTFQNATSLSKYFNQLTKLITHTTKLLTKRKTNNKNDQKQTQRKFSKLQKVETLTNKSIMMTQSCINMHA